MTSGQSPELPPESGQTAGARESTGWLTDELSQSQISQSIAFARGTEPLLTLSLLTHLSTQVAL